VDFGAAVTALGLYSESKVFAYRPGHRVARRFYLFCSVIQCKYPPNGPIRQRRLPSKFRTNLPVIITSATKPSQVDILVT